MIKIIDVETIHKTERNIKIESDHDLEIDGTGLTALPALIDPHVHFRAPGREDAEDWITASKAAIAGGVTTVFDMPNNTPPCTTYDALQKKKELIDAQLEESGIPLHYHFYFGADRNHLDEITKVRDQIIGIKVFMGSSTGDLLIDDQESLEKVFKIAADLDLPVAVHAEDESIIRANQERYRAHTNPATHSLIRDRSAAIAAVKLAIKTAQKFGTRLCILHMSTKEELRLVEEAKSRGTKVYAEVTPHHLFFDVDSYEEWGSLVQMNPPLRTLDDREALWKAIRTGVIDWIGTDHAPHPLSQKQLPFGQAPSGVASIELYLPLFLDACERGLLSLSQLVDLTSGNIRKVFRIPKNNDWVLVDRKETRVINDTELHTKCGWSPYKGKKLNGWPVMTILGGKVYEQNPAEIPSYL